jgi:hypothetical protein
MTRSRLILLSSLGLLATAARVREHTQAHAHTHTYTYVPPSHPRGAPLGGWVRHAPPTFPQPTLLMFTTLAPPSPPQGGSAAQPLKTTEASAPKVRVCVRVHVRVRVRP